MSTMRTLFLDDNPARRAWAKRELGPTRQLCTAEDAVACIGFLRDTLPALFGIEASPPFDEVYLDHDLGGETFADSSQPNTGMEVVRWIVANRPTIGAVIVHSLNAPAANEMVARLRDAGYTAEYVNFLRLVKQREEAA